MVEVTEVVAILVIIQEVIVHYILHIKMQILNTISYMKMLLIL
jgi:hypothetical protein